MQNAVLEFAFPLPVHSDHASPCPPVLSLTCAVKHIKGAYESRQVEEARAVGREVELEPLPSVVLEGVEIIPVNDKRLHGRSQRRNKTQV